MWQAQWLDEHRALWAILSGSIWGLATGTLYILWTSGPWVSLIGWLACGCGIFGPVVVRGHIRRVKRSAPGAPDAEPGGLRSSRGG
jgi:hypothetical protein